MFLGERVLRGVLLTFGFVFWAFWAPAVHAHACDYSPQGWQAFLETHWQDQYRQYQCSDNVWRLKQQLEMQGCDLEGVMTVVFRKLHPMYDPLVAQKARGDGLHEKSKWSFHQVLVYDGLVMDLDYSNEPQVVAWSEYLATMFASTEGMWMQIKPLQELKSGDLYGQFNSNQYLLFPVVAY